ncbi:MAG: hypothetical protein K6G24_14615 [Lachnospiraceae bacterium]|nr:hypothetical protein [Lachnospiraceae bacterium]
MDFSAIPSENLEALKYFVPDYSIRVIDMNYISDDDNYFQDSGLRHLVGLLNRRNNKNDLISYAMEAAGDIDSETQDLAVLMLDSDDLKKHYENIKTEEGGKNKMCKAIDDLIIDSKNEGLIEGEIKGEIKGRIETYVGLVNDGDYTFEKAASKNGLTVDEFIAKAESLGFKFKNKPE